MNIIEIKTTAYDEENFIIMTTLSEKKIIDAVYPILLSERMNGDSYDNDDLVKALQEMYPSDTIELVTIKNIRI